MIALHIKRCRGYNESKLIKPDHTACQNKLTSYWTMNDQCKYSDYIAMNMHASSALSLWNPEWVLAKTLCLSQSTGISWLHQWLCRMSYKMYGCPQNKLYFALVSVTFAAPTTHVPYQKANHKINVPSLVIGWKPKQFIGGEWDGHRETMSFYSHLNIPIISLLRLNKDFLFRDSSRFKQHWVQSISWLVCTDSDCQTRAAMTDTRA